MFSANPMKIVKLKDGSECPEMTVRATMMSLELLQNKYPKSFSALVQKCRNPAYEIHEYEMHEEKDIELIKSGLVNKTGQIHEITKAIILSAVQGSDSMTLCSPIAEESNPIAIAKVNMPDTPLEDTMLGVSKNTFAEELVNNETQGLFGGELEHTVEGQKFDITMISSQFLGTAVGQSIGNSIQTESSSSSTSTYHPQPNQNPKKNRNGFFNSGTNKQSDQSTQSQQTQASHQQQPSTNKTSWVTDSSDKISRSTFYQPSPVNSSQQERFNNQDSEAISILRCNGLINDFVAAGLTSLETLIALHQRKPWMIEAISHITLRGAIKNKLITVDQAALLTEEQTTTIEHQFWNMNNPELKLKIENFIYQNSSSYTM